MFGRFWQSVTGAVLAFGLATSASAKLPPIDFSAEERGLEAADHAASIRTAGWAAVLLGAAGGVAWAGLGLRAEMIHSGLQRTSLLTPRSAVVDRAREGRTYAIAADVSLVVGLISSAVGVAVLHWPELP